MQPDEAALLLRFGVLLPEALAPLASFAKECTAPECARAHPLGPNPQGAAHPDVILSAVPASCTDYRLTMLASFHRLLSSMAEERTLPGLVDLYRKGMLDWGLGVRASELVALDLVARASTSPRTELLHQLSLVSPGPYDPDSYTLTASLLWGLPPVEGFLLAALGRTSEPSITRLPAERAFSPVAAAAHRCDPFSDAQLEVMARLIDDGLPFLQARDCAGALA